VLQAWAAGAYWNRPEEHCCACGRQPAAAADATGAAAAAACADAPSWENGAGLGCAGYVQEGFCHQGQVLQRWTIGPQFRHPEQSCCACGRTDAGTTPPCAADSPGWTNGAGLGCAEYESEGLCGGGRVPEGQAWAAGAYWGFPERNCCACGKGAAVMNVNATATAAADGCADTAGWSNGAGLDCGGYAVEAFCQTGQVREQWAAGVHFAFPEVNCCACGSGGSGGSGSSGGSGGGSGGRAPAAPDGSAGADATNATGAAAPAPGTEAEGNEGEEQQEQEVAQQTAHAAAFPSALVGGLRTVLPVASARAVLTLSAVSATAGGGVTVTPVARSYAGHDWELSTGSVPAAAHTADDAAADDAATDGADGSGLWPVNSTDHGELPPGLHFGGVEYRTMDNCPPAAPLGACASECQELPLRLPDGWALAPFSEGLLAHAAAARASFGTRVLVFASGDGYGTHGYLAGGKFGAGLLRFGVAAGDGGAAAAVEGAKAAEAEAEAACSGTFPPATCTFRTRGCAMKVLVARGAPTTSPTPSPTSSPTRSPTPTVMLAFAAARASSEKTAAKTAAQVLDGSMATFLQTETEADPWWEGQLADRLGGGRTAGGAAEAAPVGRVFVYNRPGTCGTRSFTSTTACGARLVGNWTAEDEGLVVGLSNASAAGGSALVVGHVCGRITADRCTSNGDSKACAVGTEGEEAAPCCDRHVVDCRGAAGLYVVVYAPGSNRILNIGSVLAELHQPPAADDDRRRRRLGAAAAAGAAAGAAAATNPARPRQRRRRRLQQASAAAPVGFLCGGAVGWCTIDLPAAPAGTVYRVDEFGASTSASAPAEGAAVRSPSDDAAIARFLIQATWGPNRAAIAGVANATTAGFAQWVREQMDPVAIPATLHRKYFRQRANPRVPANHAFPQFGGARAPCSVGSRWHRYTFTDHDAGKVVHFVPATNANGTAANRTRLVVDGVVRTEVEGAYAGPSPLGICRVREGLGAYVEVAAPDDLEFKLQVTKLYTVSCHWKVSSALPGGNPPLFFPEAEDGSEAGAAGTTSGGEEAAAARAAGVVFTAAEMGGAGTRASVGDYGLNGSRALVVPSVEAFSAGELVLASPSQGLEAGAYLLQSMSCPCPFAPAAGDYDPLLHMRHGGVVLRLDNRMALLRNTLEEPAVVTGAGEAAAGCPTAPRTIFNRALCQRRPAVCAASRFSNAPLTLDHANLRHFYTANAAGPRYVYEMRGLRLEDIYQRSPCQQGYLSRWRRAEGVGEGGCASSGGVGAATVAAIAGAIRASGGASEGAGGASGAGGGANANLREVNVFASAAGQACDAAATRPAGAGEAGGITVPVDGACWQHVHPNEGDVVDATYWATEGHPGNAAATGFFPIKMFAEMGSTVLRFPASHTMTRWRQHRRRLPVLGKLGDAIGFAALPAELQTDALAEAVGAPRANVSAGGGQVVCGSPGEVANEPSLGAKLPIKMQHAQKDTVGNSGVEYLGDTGLQRALARMSTKHVPWTMAALFGRDQLRQRVAWALSQITVVSAASAATPARDQEPWHAFYDIFVRHAFGNYADVLREVSYSPLMGAYLTFLDNQAFAESGSAPDENYARESMQLFSVGLAELNEDGTQKTAEGGGAVPTYDSADVLSFARAWTGFRRRAVRSNVEALPKNDVDPFEIRGTDRDMFPKKDLRDNFIGDHRPLCNALPPRSFLRRGALYRYLGATSAPEGFQDSTDADGVATYNSGELVQPLSRLAVDPSSELHGPLCAAASGGGECSFPMEVTLAEDLACHGIQCDVDTPRTVRVAAAGGAGSNATAAFYEHVRPPCVELTFYADPARVARSSWIAQCADPTTASAGALCAVTSWECHLTCHFAAERVTKAEADRRCAAAGRPACSWFWTTDASKGWNAKHSGVVPKDGCSPIGSSGADQYQWMDAPCRVRVQVDGDGYVSIIHGLEHDKATNSGYGDTRSRAFQLDSGNKFSVTWGCAEGEAGAGGEAGAEGEPTRAAKCFPDAKTGCSGAAGCSLHGQTCLCDIAVATAAVYTDADDLPATGAEAAARLRIGSAAPGAFDNGTYARCATLACERALAAGVEVWLHTGDDAGSGVLDARSIFKVTVERTGQTIHLANTQSIVTVGGNATAATEEQQQHAAAPSFWFRNPPHFMSFTEPTARDAEYETDAVLDHLVHHENTAPFISKRLIQRMTSSNPSPRYVRQVAEAFRTGAYGGRAHSGRYGDLGATVTAILLDREARSPVLEQDPFAGLLREPMAKVLHVLRANEAGAVGGQEVEFKTLEKVIGMMPFRSESVFNFYLPDYQPFGPLRAAGLASPEAQLGTTPLHVSTLDAMQSVVKYGVTNCHYGIGTGVALQTYKGGRSTDGGENCWASIEAGRATADTTYGFAPGSPGNATAVVAELSLLLTAGRLNKHNTAVVEAAYRERWDALEWMDANGPGRAQEAMVAAQVLVTASAEFQAASGNARRPWARVQPAAIAPQGRPYRAVVVLFMDGGADSWNILMPHSGCGDFDLLGEYQVVRGNTTGGVAVAPELLLPLNNSGWAENGTPQQPCGAMATHPAFPFLHQLYGAGEASFLANVGTLVEPVDATDMDDKKLPDSLFAHNLQIAQTHSVHAAASASKGVLGRIAEALSSQEGPYRVAPYSIKGNQKIFDGSVQPDIVGSAGVLVYSGLKQYGGAMAEMNGAESGSAFAETWNAQQQAAMAKSSLLAEVLAKPEHELLTAMVPMPPTEEFEDTLTPQLKQVAKLIRAHKDPQLDTERDLFYVSLHGFDTHLDGDGTVSQLFQLVDHAIEAFHQEMQAQGLWPNVTVLAASDFARTLHSNGRGTDHGWGGNYFMVGGGVRGGQILGEYPTSLSEGMGYKYRIKSGRMIPSTPWEAVWYGLAQWLGVDDEKLPEVLPNMANFPKSAMLPGTAMFK
jgi:cullin-associated NEDD8-dissociated protein 1